MERQRLEDGEIVGGVDTHKQAHVAAAVDRVGRLLGTSEFPATSLGYRDLLRWLRGHGVVSLIGVEGTGTHRASPKVAPWRHPGSPVGLPRHHPGACPSLEPAGSRNRRLRRAVATTHTTRLSRAPGQDGRRIRGRFLAPGRCRGQSRPTPLRSKLCRSVRREPTRRILRTAAPTQAQPRRKPRRQPGLVGRCYDPTTS